MSLGTPILPERVLTLGESRLRSITVLLVIAATAAVFLPNMGAADHPNTVPCAVPGVLCPDLTVDGSRFGAFVQTRSFTANSCSVQEGTTQPGLRTLLRFTFTTPNSGLADLVVGRPQDHPETFEWGPCHGHWHFKNYADYRLWTPGQFATYTALRAANPGVQHHEIIEDHPELQPIRGDKRGFCVIDLINYGGLVPRWQSCGLQGISVGWADEYWWGLDGQWIDITGVPRGEYVLEAEVNAEHVYAEMSYDNNRAWRTVTI